MPHLLRILLLLAALAGPAHAVPGLTPPAPQPAQAEPGDEPTVEASGQAVEVDPTVTDEQIAARVREILEATEQFRGLDVRVRDGVVVLEGVTTRDDARGLAADLARRTAGVAAVVNNIAVDRGPVWTLDPAREELDDLWRALLRALPLLGIGLGILLLSLLVAGLISRAASRLFMRTTESELLRAVLEKTVFILVVLIGLYLCLRISGLTGIAVTVISGTGLIGLVVGFAFRDIAENFLASLLLTIQRPFRIGDVIEVDSHLGVVRKVTSRGTLLIDFDGNHIQIANATVYKNTIKNFTANPKVRINFTVGIGYDDDIAGAQAVIRRTLDDHPAVLDDPEPLILVEQLGPSTVNLRVYFWIDTREHSMLKMKSAAIRLTVAALLQAGVSMPDEAREVIFPKGLPIVPPEGPKPEAPEPDQGEPPRPEPTTAPAATPAEGDLTSEKQELEKQASQSREPEEGANVLPVRE